MHFPFVPVELCHAKFGSFRSFPEDFNQSGLHLRLFSTNVEYINNISIEKEEVPVLNAIRRRPLYILMDYSNKQCVSKANYNIFCTFSSLNKRTFTNSIHIN